jgi:predicted dienelactone hydrolase
VGVRTLELVDTSRPTPANRDYPGAPERRLVVEVWYPAEGIAGDEGEGGELRDATPDASSAPYPLIMFAHGYSSTRTQSKSYTQHLASHGYVVASPTFPLSSLDAPGGPRLKAVLDQPADVSFVIDEVLRRSAGADDPLSGLIDGERIGMTGHSLGGLTTLLTTYGDNADARIKAAAPLSAPACFVGGGFADQTSVPIMVVSSSRDLIVSQQSIRHGYDVANAPRYFVNVLGGDHVNFGDSAFTDEGIGSDVVSRIAGDDLIADAIAMATPLGGDLTTCLADGAPPVDDAIPGDQQRELLRTYTTPFFDAYLRDDEAALRLLHDVLLADPAVRAEYEPGAG